MACILEAFEWKFFLWKQCIAEDHGLKDAADEPRQRVLARPLGSRSDVFQEEQENQDQVIGFDLFSPAGRAKVD